MRLRLLSARCFLHSFNPRPPFPGGDAAILKLFNIETGVSIHAPRFREAMLWEIVDYLETGHVSIHAPRFREAMPLAACEWGESGMFQSTPPVSGRRCPNMSPRCCS